MVVGLMYVEVVNTIMVYKTDKKKKVDPELHWFSGMLDCFQNFCLFKNVCSFNEQHCNSIRFSPSQNLKTYSESLKIQPFNQITFI